MKNCERVVICQDVGGNIIEHRSVLQAASFIGRSKSSIVSYCSRSDKFINGFKWTYKEYPINDEIWIEHPNLPIECSDCGRVRKIKTKRVLKPVRINKIDEYLGIRVGKRCFRVHRLIAETFIENPENKPTVDHLDSNPTNNNLDNLRWATLEEQWETRRKNLPIIPILDQ